MGLIFFVLVCIAGAVIGAFDIRRSLMTGYDRLWWRPTYSRAEQPIRFWGRVIGSVLAVAMSIAMGVGLAVWAVLSGSFRL